MLSVFDRWLQESINSKPADFGLGHAMKFCAACAVMLTLLYPIHRIAMPLIHEGGHFFVAKISGKTPPLFVVGNSHEEVWVDFVFQGTRFVISPKGGGSQVLFGAGQKNCAIAAGGPLATLIIAIGVILWCWRQREKPITVVYVVTIAVGFDAVASTLVNTLSSLPGADGVFLRTCLPWL